LPSTDRERLLASLTLAACGSGGGKTSESNPVPTGNE
jgi:hypothetical protein